MEIKFTEENLKRLEEVKSHYPTKDAALMGALWIAQEQFGWLSKDVMQYVGDVLGIPYEHVLGVAEFYTMYNKQPVGKYHLQVCTNVSCMLCGGYDVVDYISLNPSQRRQYQTKLPYPSIHLIKYLAYTTWLTIRNDVLTTYCPSPEDKALVKVHHSFDRFPYKLRLLHFHNFVKVVSPDD